MSSSKALLECFFHPSELSPLLEMKARRDRLIKKYTSSGGTQSNEEYCFNMLTKVSRSFAVVIQELGDELRLPICVFYLALRGLDTIEDDTTIEAKARIQYMKKFAENQRTPGWTFVSAGKDDEKALLENYDRVIDVFLKLKPAYQDIIEDITKKMCDGMAEFALRPVVTKDDYNLYCHYVAGLVGIGLSRMFASSGLEDQRYNHVDDLANSMGLCLQKTNIIRDYLEDYEEDRVFWPKEIWSLYAKEIGDFTKPENLQKGLDCLNHLVCDALGHVKDALEYMDGIADPQNFAFCAIPQVMAIATLSCVYNNPKVFKQNVKMRRGLTAKMVVGTSDMADLKYWYYKCISELEAKIDSADPHGDTIRAYCVEIRKLTVEGRAQKGSSTVTTVATVAGGVAAAALIAHGTGVVDLRKVRDALPLPDAVKFWEK